MTTDCHAIAFKPIGVVDKVEIEYIEFMQSEFNSTTPIPYNTENSNSVKKRNASPEVGMPIRKQGFNKENSTINAIYKGD